LGVDERGLALKATTLGRLAAAGAIALWGVSFVATKAALRDVSPVTLIFTRFAFGSIVLFLVLGIRREPLVPPRDTLPVLALLGFVGIFVHQMLQANGLTLTTAIRTGWLIALTPIWSAVLSTILFGESFGVRKTAGLLLGTAGAILVVTRGQISLDVLALPTTIGDLLILASTVNWAIYSILGRQTLKRLGSTRAMAAAMLLGWAMIVPFFIRNAGWHDYEALSLGGIVSILFLGIGCSGLGYWFWAAALERVQPTQVAAFLYAEPLVTLVAATSLLGESLTASTILGGMLVILGVAVVQRA
jgi:drug/metabolite transporter (DMT)-like permease